MQEQNRPQNWPQHQDSSVSVHTNHSPQQWFRSSFNQSLPNIAKPQQQTRAFGFSSIRDIARASRRPLASLSTNTSEASIQTLRTSNSLYGTLRDQCSPPSTPLAPDPPPSSFIAPGRSHSSSAASSTRDTSGVLTNTTYLKTPSSAKYSTFYELETKLDPSASNMGNKSSSVIKKSHSVRERQPGQEKRPVQRKESLKEKPGVGQLDGEHEEPPEPLTKDPEPNKKPPATFSSRGSPPQVQVPRRRSSLTALHLDNSNFNTFDPKLPNAQHNANALMEPLERQSSTRSETIRPVNSNASTLTAATVTQNPDSTLSPPLLSPNSLPSSASSQSPSMAVPSVSNRNSGIGASRIHLPKTFPEGPVPIPIPKLTTVHYQCFARHRTMLPSKNVHCPVACMACAASPQDMWKCHFCYLRICPGCMVAMDKRGRSLGDLMVWIKNGKDKEKEKSKENVAEGIRAEDFALKGKVEAKNKEDVEKAMEEAAAKKSETMKKRETR